MFLIQEVDLLPTPSKLSHQQTHVSYRLMGIPEAGRVRGQGEGVVMSQQEVPTWREEKNYFIPVSTIRMLNLGKYSPPKNT